MTHNLAHLQSHNLTHNLTHSLSHRQQLIQHLQQHLKTHIANDKVIDKYLRKYIDYIISELHKTYTQQVHKLYSSHYYYDSTSNRTNWGRISINSKQVWAIELVLPALMHRIYDGHSGVSSAYAITRDVVVNAIKEYSFNSMPAPKPVVSDNFVDTKINRASLVTFIDNKDISLVERSQAKKILANTDMHDMFRQAVKTPVENRIYLLGINLQQVKKTVRAAALSGQWSYDVNCAVFAIFAAIAHELTGKSSPAIMSYIQDRTAIRKQIHDETGLSIDQVKQLLISVGFGKRSRGADNLAVLMTSPTAKAIVKEFRKASSIVYKNFKGEGSKNKCLANLFFTWETELMNEFVYQSKQNSNLSIHDCVILLNKTDIDLIVPRMTVSFTTHMEYFKFEETQI